MEDLEAAPGSPALQAGEEPQGLNDPGDNLNADVEEESRQTAPLGDPTADVDDFEDDEAPETVETMNEAEEDMAAGGNGALDSDDESELEELDETQFQDFDPSALQIPEKPVAVDESNVGQLGVHKRKRTEEEERERKRKKKLAKRDKAPRSKKKKDRDADDDDFEGGVEIDGKRQRKSKLSADGRPVKSARRPRSPVAEENEDSLSPEERRRRALDRKMDEALALNRPRHRRRGGGIDLEAAADAEIEDMRQRMAKACELDAEARAKGEVATHKLAILPKVTELMNRNTIQSQLVDPDINILEAVRFMLEPAYHDAALPNYKIQRELFGILGRLNIGKEALVASGIGKIVLFYTKSVQPQPDIKRMAEKLVGEWMRVVLKKHKNLKHTTVESRSYDPLRSSQGGAKAASQAEIAAERRRKVLAQPVPGNRARVEGGVGTYTIAPMSSVGVTGGVGRKAGEDAFRKIAQRSAVNPAKK